MLFVFIGGASASGKSELSEQLAIALNAKGIKTIELAKDHYYKRKVDRRCNSFDEIAAYDVKLLTKHLKDLEAGEPIARPIYVMGEISDRLSETVTIDPTEVKVVIVEGILALENYKQHGLENVMSVFVHSYSFTDYIQRRVGRDETERNTTPEVTRHRELHGVRDAFWQNILPTKNLADYTITNSGTDPLKAKESIDKGVALLLPKIEERLDLKNSISCV